MNNGTNLTLKTRKCFLDSLGSCVDFLFLAASRILDSIKPKRNISRETYEQQIDYYRKNCWSWLHAVTCCVPSSMPDYYVRNGI